MEQLPNVPRPAALGGTILPVSEGSSSMNAIGARMRSALAALCLLDRGSDRRCHNPQSLPCLQVCRISSLRESSSFPTGGFVSAAVSALGRTVRMLALFAQCLPNRDARPVACAPHTSFH